MKLTAKILFLIVFSASIYGQNIPLQFEIDSVKIDKSDVKNHKYSIFYKAVNLTNHPLSFFLLPNSLIANAASSMTLFPVYRIYQNNALTELDGPFYERYPNDLRDGNSIDGTQLTKEKIESLYEKYIRKLNLVVENYRNNGGTSTDTTWILQNQQLLDSKMVLQPNEVRHLTITTNWDKKRYFNQDNIEYYLNENDKFEITLSFDLKRNLWKNTLSDAELKAIQKDKSYIQGVFKTNKVLIEFKE